MQDPYGYSPNTSGNGNASPDNFAKEKYDIELLKSYKELLDCGIISQAEFEAKKQEVLNKKKPNQPSSFATQTQSWQPQEYDELFSVPAATPVIPTNVYNAPEPEPYEAETRYCPICARRYPASEVSCPFCEIRENAIEANRIPKQRGMKWNKFMSILLLLSGIFYILCALVAFFIGIGLGSIPAFVATGIFIGMAIFAFITRDALDWNKKRGPVMLFFFYHWDIVALAIAAIVFVVTEGDYGAAYDMFAEICRELLADFLPYTMIPSLVLLAFGSVLFFRLLLLLLNFIYYFKRRHIFVL